MSYGEIFLYGWILNAIIFMTNFIIAINTMKQTDMAKMMQEHSVLSELKNEIDKYYPYRGFETLLSYFIPFTAFYRGVYRIIEMNLFFKKNQNTTMFDFMVYRYQKEIQVAKAKDKK